MSTATAVAPSGIELRDYQYEAIAAVEQGVEDGAGRQIVAIPTGTGKTLVLSELLRRCGGTALILAHRDELLSQARDKLVMVAPELALNIGFVQAGRNDVHAPVVIGSVQTLAVPGRLAQLPRIYDFVAVDECHHAPSDSYLRILEHVADSGMIVGFTATPERADDKDLRTAFDAIAYARSLEEMIREGWLCDLRALRVQLEQLDLGKVKKTAGDYQADALGHAMEDAGATEHVVAAYLEHAADRRTVAFFPTVALSSATAEAFRAAGVNAAHLDGTTPKDERREILANLSAGRIDVICNVAVLCLDAETEILTDRGWVGPEEITAEHEVANWWYDGSITWAKPEEIVRRPRQPGERMVNLETRCRSIRVTEGHRMIYRATERQPWSKCAARDLVHRSLQIPVSGRSAPRAFETEEPAWIDEMDMPRRVSSSAYQLRTREAYEWDASYVESERRLRHRMALCHKAPHELTREECWLIGFWIGDGSVDTKARGGREYSMSQSLAYPAIIARVDACLSATGIHSNRHTSKHSHGGIAQQQHVTWTMPRGTGSGSQQRVGVYANGATKVEVAAGLGCAVSTVFRWQYPEKSVAYMRAYRSDWVERKRQEAEDLARAQREIDIRRAVRKAGAALAEAYSMSARMARVLAQAEEEASSGEEREALAEAGMHYRRMSDAIVRALGVSS